MEGFDNEYGATGTCGLASISSICKFFGMDIFEPEVVRYAMENNLCEKHEPRVMDGAITTMQAIKIFEHYGILSYCEIANIATPARIVEVIGAVRFVPMVGLYTPLLKNKTTLQ